MKLVEVDQGSEEWLFWRKSVITATDCPAILGSSPWATAYKVWQRKLGLLEEQKSNDAMERGKRLEPEARRQFIDSYNINMTPAVVESTEFNFLGASLDGLSDCGKYVLEVKCGGSNLHKQAEDGKIPEYYAHQVQHQLLVTGAEKAFYYSFDGTEGVCIEIFPDPDFKALFMPKAREFWKCVAFSEPPELQDSDYKDMSENSDWLALADDYKTTCEFIKRNEVVKENLRKALLALCGDQSCSGHGLKVMKTAVRGRVAYDEIPEIKDIDLEKYRKKSSVVWKIMQS